ncbi:MAG TPA: fused MFS/spermidine synthase [Longimicrobium sp.]|nr:fused MFS/spermidine synthase [Longimicrobium sp.]
MSEQTQAIPVSTTLPTAATSTGRDRVVLMVYTAAIFSSAFLLFLVQPMFSRMVLPLLGGTPAVWNTCMLFFQAALLGGYLYAHLGASRLGIRRQAAVHVVLLAVAALMLPVSVAGAAPRGGAAPIPWLLGLMVTTVGLPFLVLSATGPMLQKWFAGTGHPGAANPYWLYAASNLGSMLALLGYPFVMEPRLRLAAQSGTWAIGYGVLALLVIACAYAVWRLAPAGVAAETADAASDREDAAPVAARERLVWTGLAFIPSSLLLSVTSFITTDVAPVPLLWVVPLALYLLTFTLAFAVKPPLRHKWMLAVQPFVIAAISLLLMYGWTRKPLQVIPIHLAGLFVTAMVCHGELARLRPSVRHLTEFYLWIAVGGVLGGIFNVLVAPLVFTRTWEYPIVLTLACLARPWPRGPVTTRGVVTNLLRCGALVFALLLVSRADVPGISHTLQMVIAFVLLALVSAGLGRAPVWLAACVGASLLIRTLWVLQSEPTLLAHRSFYGRYTVLKAAGGIYHALYHGSTLHGAQSMLVGQTREPLTYYVRSGPLGRMFAARAPEAGRRRVAVIGLGTGTLAAYSNAGEEWTFYEIDPGIVKMASNPLYFRYLSESPARLRVVLGDARLSIAHAPPHGYDMILVDAFNSDAIPVHLLTREALGVYLDKLAPGGVVALHLSNRYLDLQPVVAALARERGLSARVGSSVPTQYMQSASSWAVVARSDADLGTMAADAFWRPVRNPRGIAPWTDDFSSLLSVWGK